MTDEHRRAARPAAARRAAAGPCSTDAGLLTEGPRWDAEAGELLWVDILGSHVPPRPARRRRACWPRSGSSPLDRHVGAVAPAVDGGWVLAAGTGFLHVDEGGAVRELAQPEVGRADVRMNDGACDAAGRFWAGTMAYDESPGAGALYRLELDGTLHHGADRPDHLQRDRLEPRRRDDVPRRQRHRARSTRSTSTRPAATSPDDERSSPSTSRASPPTASPSTRTARIWVALWDGGAVRRYRPDGSAARRGAVPRRPADVVRVRWAGPFHALRHHGPARPRRCRPGPPARRRARVPHRGPRGHRCAVQPLSRAARSGGVNGGMGKGGVGKGAPFGRERRSLVAGEGVPEGTSFCRRAGDVC